MAVRDRDSNDPLAGQPPGVFPQPGGFGTEIWIGTRCCIIAPASRRAMAQIMVSSFSPAPGAPDFAPSSQNKTKKGANLSAKGAGGGGNSNMGPRQIPMRRETAGVLMTGTVPTKQREQGNGCPHRFSARVPRAAFALLRKQVAAPCSAGGGFWGIERADHLGWPRAPKHGISGAFFSMDWPWNPADAVSRTLIAEAENELAIRGPTPTTRLPFPQSTRFQWGESVPLKPHRKVGVVRTSFVGAKPQNHTHISLLPSAKEMEVKK